MKLFLREREIRADFVFRENTLAGRKLSVLQLAGRAEMLTRNLGVGWLFIHFHRCSPSILVKVQSLQPI